MASVRKNSNDIFNENKLLMNLPATIKII